MWVALHTPRLVAGILGSGDLILEFFTRIRCAHLCLLCSRIDLSLLQRGAEYCGALRKCVRSLFLCLEMGHCCVALAGLVLAG